MYHQTWILSYNSLLWKFADSLKILSRSNLKKHAQHLHTTCYTETINKSAQKKKIKIKLLLHIEMFTNRLVRFVLRRISENDAFATCSCCGKSTLNLFATFNIKPKRWRYQNQCTYTKSNV